MGQDFGQQETGQMSDVSSNHLSVIYNAYPLRAAGKRESIPADFR